MKEEIHEHMTSDKKMLIQEEVASAKRNLMSVGCHVDTPVDLVPVGNTDVKGPSLGNGQTLMMRTPTQVEFVEGWSENRLLISSY